MLTVHTRQGRLFMLTMALLALVALTLPYALNLTWATPAGLDHQLTYDGKGGLLWDNATNIDENGVARLNLFGARAGNAARTGAAVLAPGSAGHNTVRLQNTAAGPVRFTAVLYRLDGDTPIPVQPTLQAAGAAEAEEYALPAAAYAPGQQTGVVRAITGTVNAESLLDITVDWQWPYEVDDPTDAADTALGSAARLANVTLGLYITVMDDNVYMDGTGGIISPDTGDAFAAAPYAAAGLAALAGLAMLLAVCLSRRRKVRPAP